MNAIRLDFNFKNIKFKKIIEIIELWKSSNKINNNNKKKNINQFVLFPRQYLLKSVQLHEQVERLFGVEFHYRQLLNCL